MGRRKTSTAHVKIRLVSDHAPCHRTRSQSPRLPVQIVHSGLDAFSQVNLTHQVERFLNPLDFISCNHLLKSPQKHFEREGLFRKGNSSSSCMSQTSQIFSLFFQLNQLFFALLLRRSSFDKSDRTAASVLNCCLLLLLPPFSCVQVSPPPCLPIFTLGAASSSAESSLVVFKGSWQRLLSAFVTKCCGLQLFKMDVCGISDLKCQ